MKTKDERARQFEFSHFIRSMNASVGRANEYLSVSNSIKQPQKPKKCMKIFMEIKRYFLRISSKGSKAGPKNDLGVGSQKLIKIQKELEKFTE